jgi:hypothetical protein
MHHRPKQGHRAQAQGLDHGITKRPTPHLTSRRLLSAIPTKRERECCT